MAVVAALTVLATVCALSLLFAPAFRPETHAFVLEPRPAAEAGIALALVAAASLLAWRSRWLAWLLAPALVLLAALNLAAALVPTTLERELDLWWDLRQVPGLAGLLADAVGWGRATLLLGGGGVGALLAVAAVAGLLYLAGRWLARSRAVAATTLALSGALALLGLVSPLAVSANGIAAFGRQTALVYRIWQVASGRDSRYSAALAAPALPPSDLARLGGRDVHLVFFESYGTVVFDRPEFRRELEPSFNHFAEAASRAGYSVVSRRLVSPTFGGGSWLAHGTLATGIRLNDQLLYRLLLESKRTTLPRLFDKAGYRTVQVVPGIKALSPGNAFWGFAKTYDAASLGYRGRAFGWFTIPDQYTLETVAKSEAAPTRPLFTEWVLVSSHTPFAPVPPYVEDWGDAGPYRTVPEGDWARIFAQPDWYRLERPYVASVAYDLDVLGAWLGRLQRDALVVILGDHQPPSFVAGENQPWTVPIHILARDKALLRPFLALGYSEGVIPDPAAPPRGMERFLGDFLAALDGNGSAHASLVPPAPK